MSGFTAAAVSTLDYDFTGVAVPPGHEPFTDKGVVAEPTDAALEKFYSSMSDLRDAVTDESAASDGQIGQIRAIVIEFCAGSPDAATLTRLPPRYLQAFTRWLLTELGGGDPKD